MRARRARGAHDVRIFSDAPRSGPPPAAAPPGPTQPGERPPGQTRGRLAGPGGVSKKGPTVRALLSAQPRAESAAEMHSRAARPRPIGVGPPTARRSCPRVGVARPVRRADRAPGSGASHPGRCSCQFRCPVRESHPVSTDTVGQRLPRPALSMGPSPRPGATQGNSCYAKAI